MTTVLRQAALIGAPAHLALRGGGGGLAHLLVRLAIWHWLWRLVWLVWRVPAVGPVIVIGVVLAVIAWIVLRRGNHRWPRRGAGGPAGRGPGTGPGDW